MRFQPIFAGIIAASALAATGGKASAAKKAAQLEEGRKIYEINFVACHGAQGKGDGAAAAAMEPKPRDFTDAAYMKRLPLALGDEDWISRW
jgi:cytochrome c